MSGADFSCSCCGEAFPAKLPERTDNWTATRFDKFFADRGWTAAPVKCPGCIKKATAWASRPVAMHAAARVFDVPVAPANVVTVTLCGPASENAVEREHRFGSGEKGGMIDLRIDRRGSDFVVTWAINRGRAWAKAWKRTERGEGAEAAAVAFANEKWAFLVAWLEKLEPQESYTAADAFSAQVSSMMR